MHVIRLRMRCISGALDVELYYVRRLKIILGWPSGSRGSPLSASEPWLPRNTNIHANVLVLQIGGKKKSLTDHEKWSSSWWRAMLCTYRVATCIPPRHPSITRRMSPSASVIEPGWPRSRRRSQPDSVRSRGAGGRVASLVRNASGRYTGGRACSSRGCRRWGVGGALTSGSKVSAPGDTPASGDPVAVRAA